MQAPKLRPAEIHGFSQCQHNGEYHAAAIQPEGTTVIRNAAKDRKIIGEQNFYNRLGARIRGAARSDPLRVFPVTLSPIEYTDPRRLGNYMLAARSPAATWSWRSSPSIWSR